MPENNGKDLDANEYIDEKLLPYCRKTGRDLHTVLSDHVTGLAKDWWETRAFPDDADKDTIIEEMRTRFALSDHEKT